jgi:hypothetical protein
MLVSLSGLPIHPRQMQAKGRVLIVFVPGGDQAVGLVAVAGVEGFLFAGGDVFAVVGAPVPAEDTVTVFHQLIHVASMNPLELTALASRGRDKPCRPG